MASGPGQRFFLAKANRRIRKRMRLLVRVLRKIYLYWLACEIKRKAIKMRPDWNQVAFVPTAAAVTVDVGREAQQNREDIKFGNRTLKDDCAENGLDWLDVRRQKELEAVDAVERAQKLANKTGISFEIALNLITMQTPNGNLPMPQPSKQDPVSDDE